MKAYGPLTLLMLRVIALSAACRTRSDSCDVYWSIALQSLIATSTDSLRRVAIWIVSLTPTWKSFNPEKTSPFHKSMLRSKSMYGCSVITEPCMCKTLPTSHSSLPKVVVEFIKFGPLLPTAFSISDLLINGAVPPLHVQLPSLTSKHPIPHMNIFMTAIYSMPSFLIKRHKISRSKLMICHTKLLRFRAFQTFVTAAVSLESVHNSLYNVA